MNAVERQARMLGLVDQMLPLVNTLEIRLTVLELRDRIMMPMESVLRRVPGVTVIEKTERLRVSRSTWYKWLEGRTRPNSVQAKRLAKLTGIPVEKIHRTRRQLATAAPAGATARAARGA